MKDLVIYMPYIYCYMSGVLVIWGLYTVAAIRSLIQHKVKDRPAHLNAGVAVTISVCIAFILGSLFVYPDLTSKYLNILIGLELISTAVLFYLCELLSYVNQAIFNIQTKKHNIVIQH